MNQMMRRKEERVKTKSTEMKVMKIYLQKKKKMKIKQKKIQMKPPKLAIRVERAPLARKEEEEAEDQE